VEGVDQNFYGVTAGGGVNGYGTVFRITPTGELTTLYSFGGSDGIEPEGGLLLASDSHFYGTTARGGAFGDGTVFEITLQGALTTLHNFDSTDGRFRTAGLAQHTSGTIYGTTRKGGRRGCDSRHGFDGGQQCHVPRGAGPIQYCFTYRDSGYRAVERDQR
jgi:uncharacterized repeat protein (TIGR03803 family)